MDITHEKQPHTLLRLGNEHDYRLLYRKQPYNHRSLDGSPPPSWAWAPQRAAISASGSFASAI